ncbi:NADPH-dependent FMN reductase [Chengkuizengella axinellae]|uniref:NADPH-dependent FMN reductase n=1 Tax=Chengkuizengella axinellae TaxID=3064388 RepID=A0ABT9J2T0_9BACL|nr:NADPH-dependent FMN reductase [Chengkuizengella sp. 2205SS18-9]MDP5275932.1 NADPH-dependent FMN reductase [Chengkuizengella sp. 2205SS18-9]
MKLLVINGTPRKFGRTGVIGNYISNQYNADLIDLSEGSIPLYNGEEEQNEIPSVKQLRQLAYDADGVVLTSPEYHNAMSGALKNALDFLGSAQFEHKPVAIIAVAGGGKGGINALSNMRTVARGIYANVIPKQLVLDPDRFDMENKQLTAQGEGQVDEVIKELQLYMKHSVQRSIRQ